MLCALFLLHLSMDVFWLRVQRFNRLLLEFTELEGEGKVEPLLLDTESVLYILRIKN